MRTFILVLAFACILPGAAWAEPVVPVRQNGPAENRIGMAILGDGYTASELGKYATDVDLLVKALFEQPPYSTYAAYFNVYRVDVTSNESGADHPERGQTRDTALGATYNCGGIQRVICINNSLANAAAARSLPPTGRDIILVLVNDAEYGGSGGPISVASTHRDVVELVLHEGGHSFGLLGDEYEQQPPTCANSIEPPETNVAREIGRNDIKWSRWIDAGTALPTTGTTAAVVGAYQGAKYCPAGLYRPTFDSKMRSLFRPFEQVNTEQLIRRIYNLVSPIDAFFPSESTLTHGRDTTVDFSVDVPQPVSGAGLRVRWFVNGTLMGEGQTLRLDTSRMSIGTNSVEVEVADATAAVRNDPSGLLTTRHTWSLTVTGDLTEALRDLIGRWRGPS